MSSYPPLEDSVQPPPGPLSKPGFRTTLLPETGVFVAVGGTVVFVRVAVGRGVFVRVRVGLGVLLGPTGVLVGVLLGPTGVLVGVAGGGVPPHDGNLKLPMRVFHGAVPVVGIYSVV